MMDWTDRHDRYFLRLLSKHTLLYTEMVTTGAILHGNREQLLGFNAVEHPVALQLGGSVAAELARCSLIGQEWGYDEINLNLGCPSDRVQNGAFGACLMAHPKQVTECVGAMIDAVNIPVTVKTRIGIDDNESYDYLFNFVGQVKTSGCKTFIIHARNAILSGLSPKQNREIPPLKYDYVYRLKQDFPELEIVINGGITNLEQSLEHLQQVDGVMIGREAYHNPYLLALVDRLLFDNPAPIPTRHQAIEQFIDYAAQEIERGTPLTHLSRHVLGLFHAQPGARQFRRHISENAHKAGASVDLIRQAAEFVQQH